MSSDAQIAREWAEGFIKHADSAQIVDAGELAAADHAEGVGRADA